MSRNQKIATFPNRSGLPPDRSKDSGQRASVDGAISCSATFAASSAAILAKTSSQSPHRFLAEQPHCGIPGTIVAFGQPAPVGGNGDRHPGRDTQRPGQVRQ